VPGRIVARPVYAPALVAWVGRPGFSVSVAIGSVPAVGWFPLAPREVFYPGYRVSPAYVRNINVTHVTDVTRIVEVDRHPHAHVRHANRPHALTVVPAQAVSHGRPVRAAAVRVRDQGTLAALPVAASAPEVARPPVRERRTPEAQRDRDARPPMQRGPAPVAAPPAATPPRAATTPEHTRHEPRNDRPDRAAAREPERRGGATPEPPAAARQPPPASVERREGAPPSDRQVQRAESRRMQPEPAVRVERPQPRDDRQHAPQPRTESRAMPAEPGGARRIEVPQPRAERQQAPQPQAEPRPILQPRMESPRVRTETAQPRAERQHAPEPRVAAPPTPRAERQFVPQPRPETRAVPQQRMDSPRVRADAPQPRAERQPDPEPRSITQPRMEPPASRVEPPRTATPHQRQEGERRGPRDGGR
jgi:hypothetical protein